MKNLQKAGGIAAIVSAASYVFAIGLYMTVMMPLSDPGLGIRAYMEFFIPRRSLAFVWNFSMYIVHGASLVVLVLALYERLRGASPRLAAVASGFGFIWTAFVLLSGFVNIWGSDALVALYGRDPVQAENFRTALTEITLGIDSSDRLMGSVWAGLLSLAALRSGAFPKPAALFGILLGAVPLLAGLVLPVRDTTASLIFGFGAIVWWIVIGIRMLRKSGT